jgi:sugar phosphate isomerase/epimerase
MNRQLSRREFLQTSSAAAAAGATSLSSLATYAAQPKTSGSFRGTLCLFSKAVPQLSWSELAQAAKQAGFGGIDLTVRSEGHVLPDRAAIDLPKAVSAIRAEGLEVPMITTELRDGDDPIADTILRTAKDLSISYVKPGYYYYKLVDVLKERDEAGRRFRGLVALAAKYEIQVGYHNHINYVGAPIWDMAQVIEPLDPRWCGFYFDLGHCWTDGTGSGWEIASHLVMPRLKMIAVKDFRWTEQSPHRLAPVTCKMGEGMVPWSEFFKILATSDFHGPISLHDEYQIPGVTDDQGRSLSRETVPQVMAAAKENLDYLKSLLHTAYSQG